MEKIKALTSKDGKSEWPYKKKTIIAIEETQNCNGCIFMVNRCRNINRKHAPDCVFDFNRWSIYIEKPAE